MISCDIDHWAAKGSVRPLHSSSQKINVTGQHNNIRIGDDRRKFLKFDMDVREQVYFQNLNLLRPIHTVNLWLIFHEDIQE
jgi:hypothetical protein